MADEENKKNPNEDEDVSVSGASQKGTQFAPQEAVMTDEKHQPVQDGQIPLDNQGVAAGSFDALDPVGTVDIAFQQGNYKQIVGLPKLVNDKITQLTKTLVPLMEVSLIELLGASNMYKRTMGQVVPAFDNNGQLTLQFTFQYVVPNFIGMDIDYEAIKHDSQYILNKIQPVKANITKCEIDCSSGAVTLQGTL